MSKKLFAVSDVHGHFAALSDALARAGALHDGRVIVCCHRPARLGYWYDESRMNDDDAPFSARV